MKSPLELSMVDRKRKTCGTLKKETPTLFYHESFFTFYLTDFETVGIRSHETVNKLRY